MTRPRAATDTTARSWSSVGSDGRGQTPPGEMANPDRCCTHVEVVEEAELHAVVRSGRRLKEGREVPRRLRDRRQHQPRIERVDVQRG